MPANHPADDPIPAIGYIRVSTAREEMISPELQRGAILQWAAKTGHRIVDWVEDLDKTGRNFRRRIMGVIERVEGGEVPIIAVWKYSRFGRTRTGVTANLARVEKAGGQLLSATEEVDARTAIGRFQRGMIMEFNAFESDRAGEQWEETHQWRRDQGLPATGGRRFGYIWHPRKVYAPDGSITLQREWYELDRDMKDIVIGLYRQYVAGAGFASLAMALNEAGIHNAQGEVWNDRSLTGYMDSGFAAGFLRVHNEDCTIEPYLSRCPNHHLFRHPTKGHQAIIDAEVWKAYQQRRDFTRTAGPRSRAAAYPLSGLGRCAECSGAARRLSRHHHAYLSCNTRCKKGAAICEGFGYVRVAVADEAVLAWLQSVAGEVQREAEELTASRPIPTPRRDPRQQQLEAAKADVQRLERAVGRHMKVYAMSEEEDSDGTLEREHLAILADLRKQKAEAAQKVAALSAPTKESVVETARWAAQPIAIGLLEEWDTMPPVKANALLRKIVGRVDLSPGGKASVVPVWELD